MKLYKSLEQALKNSATCTHLFLRGAYTELPSKLFELSALCDLQLDCPLTHLQGDWKKLTSLRKLKINSAQLESDCFAHLPASLYYLHLSHCQLTKLDQSIGKLVELRALNLENNRIHALDPA